MVNPNNHVHRLSIELNDFGLYDIHIRAEEGATLDEILELYHDMKHHADNIFRSSHEVNTKVNDNAKHT